MTFDWLHVLSSQLKEQESCAMVYATGHTTIFIGKPLVPYIGVQVLDIGNWFLYMLPC